MILFYIQDSFPVFLFGVGFAFAFAFLSFHLYSHYYSTLMSFKQSPIIFLLENGLVNIYEIQNDEANDLISGDFWQTTSHYHKCLALNKNHNTNREEDSSSPFGFQKWPLQNQIADSKQTPSKTFQYPLSLNLQGQFGKRFHSIPFRLVSMKMVRIEFKITDLADKYIYEVDPVF